MIRTSLCQRNKARHIMTWYARIFDTDTKEIRYESLGTTKKTEAQDLMSEKLQAGDFERKSPSETITLGEAFNLYIRNLESRGVTENSVNNARGIVDCVKSIHGMVLSEISKNQLLEAFIEGNKNVSAGTHNTRRTIVKSAFKYFVNVLELIPRNIAEVLPTRKNNRKERDFWTIEQIDRILDFATNNDRRLLWAFMAFEGLRISEALNVKKEDIYDGFLHLVGKGNKPAKVPLCSRMLQELERVSWTWDFSRFTRTSKPIRLAATRAIPEGFNGAANNHRMRHSFASNLIRNNINPKALQALMRHANITTTLQIYTHVMGEDLKVEIEKMFK